jgi:hypothetical protein
MAFNLAWPRKDIYNFVAPFHWYLQYGAYLYIGIIAGAGGLYYFFIQRHKTGILPEHAAEPALPAPAHGGP